MSHISRAHRRGAKALHAACHIPWDTCPVAAVVDVENLTFFGRSHLSAMGAAGVLNRVSDFTAGVPTTTALSLPLMLRYMSTLADLGWQVFPTKVAPNAADVVLIEAAEQHLHLGSTDLIVVSGDGIFANLAAQARLHVVAVPGRLSRDLEHAATTVTLLDVLGPLPPSGPGRRAGAPSQVAVTERAEIRKALDRRLVSMR